MRIVDLIEKKKQGKTHTREEIEFIINSMMKGEAPDYQISAWLMAVYFQGLTDDETTDLTRSYVESGGVLDFSEIEADAVDKHSTGGVGDKITLMLMPIMAAAGCKMAKLSGRGLGHTGGTIDKLESIPNFRPELSFEEFFNQVKEIGGAISAQSPNLTPADGKLYALRDVTATVDSLPLIAASVVSKKIAAGTSNIVLDVKCGEGAFIKTLPEAEKLARLMVKVGKNLGKNITAIITSMDEPLGKSVGNSVEIIEAIEFLKGNYTDDLAEITFEIGAVLLVQSGKFTDKEQAKTYLKELVENKKSLEKFKEIVKAQHGNVEAIENYELLPSAKIKEPVFAAKSGYINKINALDVAKACKILGGGREKKDDKIDYAAGIVLNKKVYDRVEENGLIATIHANSAENLEQAKILVQNAFTYSENKTERKSLIYEIIE